MVVPIQVGVEFVRLDNVQRTETLARLLAPTGATAAKPWCNHIEWGHMQPLPGASIDFARTDAFVRSFHAEGFIELVLCLDSTSPWASRVPSGALHAKSPVPRPEHLDAFGQWVGAMVERYDGDGLHDMPGLSRPVRVYEIGSEFASAPGDSADGYLVMLERAHRAAHGAWSGVIVAHAAFLTSGAFDDRGADWEQGFARMSDRIGARRFADLRRLLDRPDLFDALNVHALGDPTEIDAIASWLRDETQARGYRKPVIISDTATTPFVAWGPATRCEGSAEELGLLVYPAVEEDRCRLADYFRDLVDGHGDTLAWIRAFAATDLVKKVVIAANRGVWLLNTSLVEDARWWKTRALEARTGNAAWAGLLDLEQRERRPAFFALRQLMGSLRGRDRVERLRLPRRDVRVYALDGPAGPAWVAWYEPRQLVLPGEPIPAAIVSFPTQSERVRIEEIITRPGQHEPDRLVVDTDGGTAWLEVTPTPAFVYPVP